MSRRALLISLIIVYGILLVAAASAADDSEINITVLQDCSVSITNFEAPRGGFLGRNGTGAFESIIVNDGSFSNTTVNASMEMNYMRNVTNDTLSSPEGLNLTNLTESYSQNISNSSEAYIEEYENPNSSTNYSFSSLSNETRDFINNLQVKRKLNLSLLQNETEGYTPSRDFQNFTRKVELTGANSTANFVKIFRAIPEYPYGEYNATLSVDYACSAYVGSAGENSSYRYIDENETGDFTYEEETIDFSIVRAAGGVADEGNQSTNQTLPQDVNQTGEEGETVEGDNPSPGQTPEPEPEPEPEPRPEPDPEARPNLELEPVNRTYRAERGQEKGIAITVRNMGPTVLTDITISPQLDRIQGDWDSNDASVSEISPENDLNRTFVVTPTDSVEPGLYTIPVIARNNESRLDTDYFYVDVQRTSFEPSFRILEAPRTVQMEEASEQTFPILIENIGRENLTNVTAEIQNGDGCARTDSEIINTMEKNETASLSLEIDAMDTSETCNATLFVTSQDGAFAYSNLALTVSPEEGLIPERQQPPLLAILWTIVLVGYSVLRKRLDSDSFGVNAPLILLILGEAVILLYLLVGHYGIVSVPFLPF